MASAREKFSGAIKMMYDVLVDTAKRDMNDELRKVSQSIKSRYDDNKLKLQQLQCSFPTSFSSGQIETTKTEDFPLKRIPNVQRLPPMKAYLPVQRNMLVEDESIMDSIPYFGEGDASSELVEDLCRNHNENIRVKLAKELEWIDEMVFKELTLYAQSLRAEDYNTEELNVFEVISGILESNVSPKDLRKKFKNLRTKEEKSKILPSIDSSQATENKYEKTVKSFQSKFCRRCFTYNCLLHNEHSYPAKNPHKLYEAAVGSAVSCSDQCYKNIDNAQASSLIGKHDEVWTGSDISLFHVLSQMFLKDFCAIARALQTKSCRQVKDFADRLENTEAETKSLPAFGDKIPVKKPLKLSDAYKDYRNVGMKRNGDDVAPYKPCNHIGKCRTGCYCFENGLLCEKFCHCSINECSNRFRGCQCKAPCDSLKCSCRTMSHECDPDICKCQMFASDDSKICKNFPVQRGLPKHVLLGKSDVAGWGVFAKEAIEKDEFISEYCGEVIPENETEQRARVYDKLGSNFIFKLTTDYSIDSTRKGNKIRFSNHSKDPNCYAKPIFANGNHSVAYFAKRRIGAGEELLIDYGESYSIHFKGKKKKK